MSERVLVTGVLGCLGAWVARAVVADGDDVVGYDLGENTARLDLVLGEDAARVTLVRGDITELDALERALDEHEITRVVHLAALQVPFVRANPPLGMRVNVAGTVNVFEAVSKRLDRIPGVAYASSTAVYSASDPSPCARGGRHLAEHALRRLQAGRRGHGPRLRGRPRLPSIGLRPYVVYGPGRDQGMTSGPDDGDARGGARRAVRDRLRRDAPSTTTRPTSRAHSSWPRGAEREGAAVYNPPGAVRIGGGRRRRRSAPSCPDAEITWSGDPLPVPAELESVGFDRDVGPFPRTPLDVGVAATIEHFRAAA